MDFVADQLEDGTRFRSLTIVDIYTREAVAIEVGQGLRGDDVVRTLNRVKLKRSVPKILFCDNGSEFTSQAMDLWAYRNGVKIDFSRPGKPTDNPYVAYCTSLDDCGKNRFEAARSWSLMPCCFRGGLSSGS
jgi:putative transposase